MVTLSLILDDCFPFHLHINRDVIVKSCFVNSVLK